MAYKKKYATREERAAHMSQVAKETNAKMAANGTRKGGRKPAFKMGNDPTTSCTIRETDAKYIDRMSFSLGIAKAACIRVLVLAYRSHCATFKVDEDVNAKLDMSIGELGKFAEIRQ